MEALKRRGRLLENLRYLNKEIVSFWMRWKQCKYSINTHSPILVKIMRRKLQVHDEYLQPGWGLGWIYRCMLCDSDPALFSLTQVNSPLLCTLTCEANSWPTVTKRCCWPSTRIFRRRRICRKLSPIEIFRVDAINEMKEKKKKVKISRRDPKVQLMCSAMSLRWSAQYLLVCLYKENEISIILQSLCLYSPLNTDYLTKVQNLQFEDVSAVVKSPHPENGRLWTSNST